MHWQNLFLDQINKLVDWLENIGKLKELICQNTISGFIQWLFTVLFYERIVEDKLRNYVDLCSVANVSVFILAHRQFGYYIHGRSVHGTSDVSLAEMYVSLQKENSGSCAKRGLENDSMQQTYIMALPSNFRDGLDLVYRPSGSRLGSDGRNLQYLEVNKFLDKFINRVCTRHLLLNIIK